jgi:hypothetical protein
MSVSTTITTILPTKFGQVTTGTVVKRYSGGQLNDDFTITKKPMWSPYQIHSDDSRDIKTAFEFFTQKHEKLYNGFNDDPINNLTVAQLCTLIHNYAETGGVDTFLYAPDNSGKVWCMTRHHT